MRIDSIALELASRRVSNSEVIDLIRTHSRDTYNGDLERALNLVERLLAYTGAETRAWAAPDEKPMQFIERATTRALDAASCGKQDIDLLIYAAIDRGFVEPASAYFVARALGMPSVRCFDVLDGCNGWSRAMEIASAFLQAGTYRRVLVINCEFLFSEGQSIYRRQFQLRNSAEITNALATFTMGQAVAATIVAADDSRPWDFYWRSDADLAHLCMVALPGYQRFLGSAEADDEDVILRYVSNGAALFAASVKPILEMLAEHDLPAEGTRLIVPHAATKTILQNNLEPLGIDPLVYYVYPQLGNLASASLPAGLALALDEGRLQRGDRVLTLAPAAGMSFAMQSFIY